MTPSVFSCFVRGVPIPKGSKRAFNAKNGRAFVVDVKDKSLRSWEQAIRGVLQERWQGPPINGPVAVSLAFLLLKPPSVPKRRRYPTVAPDADKLARACLDSMAAIVFRDDAQVVRLSVSKDYAEECGVRISAEQVENG